MASQYHSLFTTQGLELLREAIQNGTKLGITHMSYGDGNGYLPVPDAAYNKMINEVYRTQLNRLAPSKENPNWLEADGVIPSAVGGFNIREVGLWAGDTMVAYANYPPTYKPTADQGTAQIKTIRIVLQIDNTANFELKIDASVVMATIQAVEDAKIYAKDYSDLTKVERALSIEDLKNIDIWDGRLAFVKSYYEGSNKGGGLFKYDQSLADKNDGGIIFNGWVRQNVNHPDVYMFGAYGDWNAEKQVGHDDSIAFQKCIEYIYNNENHMRAGGKRFMSVPAGNFKISGFTIPWLGFGFEMYGEGCSTNIWLDPMGTGILVKSEYSRFRSIYFNGTLKAATPDNATVFGIDYIFDFKLGNKYLDIDVIFEDCFVNWFNTFARVAGRGFTFRNGGAGSGNILCEISCDEDLVIAGPVSQMHSVKNSMRHFKIHNNRFDFCKTLFSITGKHQVKDYINGVTISNNEITGAGVLVTSLDCTLISPIYSNNLSISSHLSDHYSGVFNVPRAKDVKDINNSWNNYIDVDNVADTRAKGISFIHRYSTLDGFLMTASSAKDLVYGLLRIENTAKNIKILNNTFDGFCDLQLGQQLIEVVSGQKVDGLHIKNNTFNSNKSIQKKWVNYELAGTINTFIEDNNDVKNLLPVESIQFIPKNLVDKMTSNINHQIAYGEYKIQGDYVKCSVAIQFVTDLTNGDLSISLPIQAIGEVNTISSYTSGSGQIKQISGFSGLTNMPFIIVNANTDQCAQIYTAINKPLSLSIKSSNAFVIFAEFTYRFKN